MLRLTWYSQVYLERAAFTKTLRHAPLLRTLHRWVDATHYGPVVSYCALADKVHVRLGAHAISAESPGNLDEIPRMITTILY
jgi:hypothetical protein